MVDVGGSCRRRSRIYRVAMCWQRVESTFCIRKLARQMRYGIFFWVARYSELLERWNLDKYMCGIIWLSGVRGL